MIADYIPNIPEELIESGKLSKFIALSVPDDDRWNPDNDTLISLGSAWREAGAQELRLDIKNLPNGAYYCRLQADGQSTMSTFVVIR